MQDILFISYLPKTVINRLGYRNETKYAQLPINWICSKSNLTRTTFMMSL